MPVLKREWMTPSVTQRKDEFGNENRTCFKLKARLNDGFTKWTGWFEDREDFDAFLWALVKGTLKYERELWDLSLPNWDPDIGENVTYEFATVTFLTTTGANTYYVPSDWDSSGSKIDCIGGGGGGGAGASSGGDGGNGGNYGAAGGGASGESAFNTQIGGSGAQGLIIVEYIPVPTINSLSNMPMLGM